MERSYKEQNSRILSILFESSTGIFIITQFYLSCTEDLPHEFWTNGQIVSAKKSSEAIWRLFE